MSLALKLDWAVMDGKTILLMLGKGCSVNFRSHSNDFFLCFL